MCDVSPNAYIQFVIYFDVIAVLHHPIPYDDRQYVSVCLCVCVCLQNRKSAISILQAGLT